MLGNTYVENILQKMLYTGSVTTLRTHIKRIGGEYHPHPLYDSSRLRSKFEPEQNLNRTKSART
jgi:hypothetical protein